jgi:hypothetical protein
VRRPVVLTAHIRRASNRRACRTFKKTARVSGGSRFGPVDFLLVPLRSLFVDVPAVSGLHLYPVRRSPTLIRAIGPFANHPFQAELISRLEYRSGREGPRKPLRCSTERTRAGRGARWEWVAMAQSHCRRTKGTSPICRRCRAA